MRYRAPERKHLPSLCKVLPHVISKTICTRQLLNKMFDRVLSESEEVRSRDGIRVLPIPDRIGLLDNVGPCPGRRTSDDRTVRNVRPDYFEFRAVSAVEDRALVYSL